MPGDLVVFIIVDSLENIDLSVLQQVGFSADNYDGSTAHNTYRRPIGVGSPKSGPYSWQPKRRQLVLQLLDTIDNR